MLEDGIGELLGGIIRGIFGFIFEIFAYLFIEIFGYATGRVVLQIFTLGGAPLGTWNDGQGKPSKWGFWDKDSRGRKILHHNTVATFGILTWFVIGVLVYVIVK